MTVEKDGIFNWQRKLCNDEDEMTASSRPFQTWAVATGKARLPTVDIFMSGTTRRSIPADCRARQPGRLATATRGHRYHGVLSWSTFAILYCTVLITLFDIQCFSCFTVNWVWCVWVNQYADCRLNWNSCIRLQLRKTFEGICVVHGLYLGTHKTVESAYVPVVGSALQMLYFVLYFMMMGSVWCWMHWLVDFKFNCFSSSESLRILNSSSTSTYVS